MSLDSLEGSLSREVKPGQRSPQRRANKLSFFEEITAEQMYTYSPAQIATILQQRENLLNVLSQQHMASGAHNLYHPSGSYDGHQSNSPPASGHPADTKPWVPREECQATYCHRCRPSFAPRSFLSLDGIVNGDIPPTAAIGFGFATRPIADARIVRNIGLRAVPLPPRRDRPHTNTSSRSSSRSSLSVLDLSDIVGDVLDYEEIEVESDAGATCDSDSPTPSASESTCTLEGEDVLDYQEMGMEMESEEGSTRDSAPPTPPAPSTGFGEGPLEVEDGVAVLEESVELGVPDVITQV
ncbi:hypothetical protein F4801DRAFT_247342 [Xylaria longipes]|nr:hypothetical protein F4801DRAFT_247342 [Xylaria longipes]